MKRLVGIICTLGGLAIIGLAVFAGCASLKDEIDSNTAAIDSCQECHSGDTDIGNQILGAQAQYENSGHYNGPRTLDQYVDTTGHIYVFHGSNAMYTNGTPCSKCHTHQGFVEYIKTGSVINIAAASQPGCFTCHEPHETGDFTLRKQTAETLVDGTSSFNYGKGNLCATCHKSLTSVSTITGPMDWSSYSGPHHGPQADLIMGVNHWAYGANTYNGASVHLTDSRVPDSCVDCHLYEPTARLSGTLQLGGHGMYLTGDVHGSEKDIVNVCKTCHPTGKPWPSTNPTFEDNGHTAPANWDGDGSTEDKLLEIEGMRDTLISYFGNGTANFSGAGTGPIVDVVDGGDFTIGSSNEWNKDWEFNPTKVSGVSLVKSQSLWNFKLFIEDRSGGIHNPTFAAQILYDAIDNLNDNAGASLTLGATRP